MKIDISQPFRWLYNNPRQSAQKAAQSTIALMVGYVAYEHGKNAWQASKGVSCNLSCSGQLYGFSEQLLATAALCLASIVIARYQYVKPLPKIPAPDKVK